VATTTLIEQDERLDEARRLGRTGRPGEALVLAQAIAEESPDPSVRMAALLRVAWHHLQLGEAMDGLAAAVAARKLAEQLGNPDRIAAAQSLSAWLLLEIGLTDDAFAEAEAAVALAGTSGGPMTLAHALNAKGTALLYAQHTRLAEQHFRWAVKVAAEAGDHSALSLFLSNLAYAFADLSDASTREAAASHSDLAIDIATEAISIARRSGDGWMLRLALVNAAEYLGISRQPELARQLMDQWAEAPGEPGLREVIHFLYTDGELRLREGDIAGARAACEQALGLAEASNHADHIMNCLRRLAEIAEQDGRTADALQLFRRYHETYRRSEGDQARLRAEAAEIRFESQHHRAVAERLADEVLRDPLTGIGNRRAFEQALAGLGDDAFAIAILDIDHFKAINDKHGHAIGDAVLRHVAAELGQVAGNGVSAARIGGEEFVLLFAGAAAADAAELCDHIREAIARAPWPERAAGLAVTASIGLATAEPGEPPMSVLDRADSHLYDAKEAGRNRAMGDTIASQSQTSGASSSAPQPRSRR
jgi:diguanylate cyclase